MADDTPREMRDGREDGLDPLEAIDPGRIESFTGLLGAMSKTAFGGRNLGEAHEVFRAMVGDGDCTIVVSVAGAAARLAPLLCEMIEHGMAGIIVCAGTLAADLCTEEVLDEAMAGMDFSRPIGSLELNRAIGRRLVERGRMPSVLGCACRRDVPVYVPAMADSPLGLDMAVHFLKEGRVQGDNLDRFFSAVPSFNPFLDLQDYTRRALGAKRLGIFTIGGGVPAHWARQVGPFVEVMNMRLGAKLPVPEFHYGVRICGVRICGVPVRGDVPSGGRFAEVHCDAAIAWPLLIRAALEEKKA